MGPDLFGRYLSGVYEGCDGFADLAALCMGTGNIGEFTAQPVQIVRDCRVGLGFRYGFGPEVADADAEGLGE